MRITIHLITVFLSASVLFTVANAKPEKNKPHQVMNSKKEKVNKSKLTEFEKLVKTENTDKAIAYLRSQDTHLFSLVNMNVNGEPVLTYAIKNKKVKLADELIRSGANLNAQDKQGFTALMWAIKAEEATLAKLIVANGGDKNIKNKDGITAMDMAKERSMGEI